MSSITDLRSLLTAEIPGLLNAKHIEGASIAFIQNCDVVASMAFGVKNTITNDPVTPQTMFEAYSLTKPLIAYSILAFCREGVLDLDQPLDEYLNAPCLMGDRRSGQITARMLLCHTGGLPDDETDHRILFNPGERWSYSTQGYCFLQRVIEQISGVPLDLHMSRRIFEPFAMTSSSLVWEDRFAPVMAQGHNIRDIPEEDRRIRIPDADSLLTTASDYAGFVVKCLWADRSHHVTAPCDPLIHMTQSRVEISDSLSWGMGWGMEEMDHGPFIWHIGGGTGAPFQNFVIADGRHGVGMVILTNSAHGGALFEPVVERVFEKRFSLFRFVQEYFHG